MIGEMSLLGGFPGPAISLGRVVSWWLSSRRRTCSPGEQRPCHRDRTAGAEVTPSGLARDDARAEATPSGLARDDARAEIAASRSVGSVGLMGGSDACVYVIRANGGLRRWVHKPGQAGRTPAHNRRPRSR